MSCIRHVTLNIESCHWEKVNSNSWFFYFAGLQDCSDSYSKSSFIVSKCKQNSRWYQLERQSIGRLIHSFRYALHKKLNFWKNIKLWRGKHGWLVLIIDRTLAVQHCCQFCPPWAWTLNNVRLLITTMIIWQKFNYIITNTFLVLEMGLKTQILHFSRLCQKSEAEMKVTIKSPESWLRILILC